MLHWLLFITGVLFIQDPHSSKKPVTAFAETPTCSVVSKEYKSYGWAVAEGAMSSVEVRLQ